MGFGDKMKDIHVTCIVSAGEDVTHIDTLGEFKNNRIIFQDEDGESHYIVIQKDVVKYIKKGSVDMRYELRENLLTKGSYATLGNRFNFEIKTLSLIRNKGKIIIKYQLLQERQVVNEATIDVTYNEVKEDTNAK